MALKDLFNSEIFSNEEHLYNSFIDYLGWLEENKLKESKLYGGEGMVAELDRMRMATMQGFQFYLRTTKSVLAKYRAKGGLWEEVFSFIEESMHAHSIEGAAAGLLKSDIVIRKLQLADKTDVSHTLTHKRVVILHTPDNLRAVEEVQSPIAIEAPAYTPRFTEVSGLAEELESEPIEPTVVGGDNHLGD